jgi:cold shock CspA family protein
MDSSSLEATGKDVFVHIFAIERCGLSTLEKGQQIEYEIVEDRGKTSAVKLKSSDPAASFGRSLR